jgi:Rieske Fe-S protein
MDRKDFLKKGCHTCFLGAAALLLPHLTGCGPASKVFQTDLVNNQLEMPLQLFDKNNLQFVRPRGWQYDIAVHKNENGTYLALLMQCTHMDNQLTAAQNGYTCSLHGSRFNSEGMVIKGPAEKGLKRYSTLVNNNNLIIHI